jgi:hypothetical protein
MKRFMIFLVVVAACIAGIGFYRGWFLVASDSGDDKRNVTFSADSSKDQTAATAQPPESQE